MPKLLYVSINDEVLLDPIISYLLNLGVDRVMIKELKSKIKSESKPEPKPEPKPEYKPEYKPEPVRPVYREPTPIVTKDKRGNQQEDMAKWIIEQHPKVIYPNDIKMWLVNRGESPTSHSTVAYLKKYRIHSNGKNKGYSYRSIDNH